MAISANSSIILVNVTCGYGDKVVLSNINLTITPGEVTALIGPNGSGKSTIMKTLSGALKPINGGVELCGDNISALSKKEIARRIGYVPQTESPAFDFTVREIVMMGRIPHSDGLFESNQDCVATEQAMRLADCLAIADRPMSQLSGGEGQRARIARALAQEAPILLMDEPTTHLDVKHQIDIGRLAKGFSEQGMAVAVAVHDLNWASAFCTRAALCNNGTIALYGTTQEVLTNVLVDQAFETEFQRIDENGLKLFALTEQN